MSRKLQNMPHLKQHASRKTLYLRIDKQQVILDDNCHWLTCIPLVIFTRVKQRNVDNHRQFINLDTF